MNVKRFSFPKKSRLLSSHEFLYVFKNSQKFFTKEITVFTVTNHLNHPRLGIIISKKYIKHAHKRNHIKRHIKETFRVYQHTLLNMDFVIKINKNINNLNKYSFKKKLKNIMELQL